MTHTQLSEILRDRVQNKVCDNARVETRALIQKGAYVGTRNQAARSIGSVWDILRLRVGNQIRSQLYL